MEQKRKNVFGAVVLTVLVVSLTVSLVIIGNRILLIFPAEWLSPGWLDSKLKYQIATLALTAIFIGLTFLLRTGNAKAYFRLGKINAEVQPEKWMGLNPKPHENWVHTGLGFMLIIAVVTAVVIYFQLIKGSGFNAEAFRYFHWVIVLSLVNSFVEEMITRYGVVVALDGLVGPKVIPVISGVIFGGIHYFGNPGGIPGVLMAGFLGWFAAKSIIETKGIFWAWLIHFVQDVIIITAIFMGSLS